MNENQVNEAPVDGAKPRPRWRGNRARVGVLAAVLGIIGAFLLLSVVAPPTVEAATLEQAVLAGAVTGGTIGGIAGTVVPGLGTGIGIVVGAVVGGFAAGIGYILGGWGQGDGAAERAEFMATDQTNQTIAQIELGKANAENIAELAQRANYYYERAAYNGAATLYQHQTEAGDPHIYDSDYVLDKALVSDEMVGSVAGSYATYNRVFAALDTIGAGYIGDYQKNSLTVGVTGSYWGETKSSAINYDNQKFVRLISYCNTPAGKYCWLNATDTIVVWNLDASTVSGNVLISDSDGVTVYSEQITLASMGGYALDLGTLDIKSGRYNVALPSSDCIWTASAAEDYHNSGIVAPGIAVYSLTDGNLKYEWGWAMLPGDQGFATSGVWLFQQDKPWQATKLPDYVLNDGYPYLRYNYPSGNNIASESIISLKPVIESIWNVSRSWRQITYAASLAGQSAYQVLIDNGGAGIGNDGKVLFPPVDIIFPDYDQLRNMTVGEILVMYYAYAGELNETFQTTNIMDPSKINMTTASFDLLIRGSVYYNGSLVIGNNTPFTLYSTLEGLSLRVGETTSLTSLAHIITWADGYSSLADYLAAKGNVQNPNITYVDCGEGWTIHVEEITFERESVQSMDLTIDKLNTYVPPELPGYTPGPNGGGDDGMTDLAGLMVICVIVGVILAVIGLVFDHTSLAIVGIIIAVICAAGWYLTENPIDLGPFCLAYTPSYLNNWWRST